MSALVIERTPDREARIAAWMDNERRLVEEAFGVAAWDTIGPFIEALPWVSDGDLALLANVDYQMISGQLEPNETARITAGRRTAAAMTYTERTTLIADRIGVRYDEADKMVRGLLHPGPDETPFDEGPAAETVGQTSLYRHLDESGVLLYVGVATRPDLRAEQHRARSPWWRFVAESVVEWHDTRQAAAEAETQAIKTELPIFNSTHNKANRDAAIAYLFAALDQAS